jgi:sodium-dependent dicarboxylate transporter 2/3/5
MKTRHQKIGLWLGPTIGLILIMLPPPETMPLSAWHTAIAAILMAIWWCTEAVHVSVTAIVPLAIFPLLGIGDIKTVAAPYANPIIYLFMGGFVIALAVEKWDLHKRIALTILTSVGKSGPAIVGGFMLASAIISMWVMNTSTTLMLLPIGVSVVKIVSESADELNDTQKHNFQLAVLLGIAYSATIGGMATIVGTAPNAFFVGFMKENGFTEIGFGQFMLVGFPLTLVMLPLAWFAITHIVFPIKFSTSDATRNHLYKLRADLGLMSIAEKRVSVVFASAAFLWMTRPLLNMLSIFSGLSDAGIAMIAATILFLIPSANKNDPYLMKWETMSKLPWGLLILFGGGLSLASSVAQTGLADWIGESLVVLGGAGTIVLVIVITTLIAFLTELTSNTATTGTFLPVVAALAIGINVDPLIFALPATLAASCAFMLPVATPPNGIVYGSGYIRIPEMVKAGFVLNIIGIVVLSILALIVAPIVFN